MAHGRVCPWWLGYFLASPLRRMTLKPARLLSPYVREGMTVLEPGPGMGLFTLELARLVGPAGRVVAVDIQPRMIQGLKRRAAKAGLGERIDIRLAQPGSLGIRDVSNADFALAFAVVHECPDAEKFFSELAASLRPGATLLFVEPSSHVKRAQFEDELKAASRAGFAAVEDPGVGRNRAALLKLA